MLFEESLPFYLYQDALLSSTTQQQFEMKPDRRSAAATSLAPSPANSKRAASKVVPRLYLTCLATAIDATQLAQLGITHVVSAIEDAPTFPSFHPLRTLHISISDYASEDILSHLPATTSFIRGALAESPTNRVLVRIITSQTTPAPDTFFVQVHCFMGISRSTTVVVAYLIATTQMTPRDALAAVRSKRTIVRPNRGFMSQLEAYHSTCSNSLQAKLADVEDSDARKRENEPKPEARRRDRRAQTATAGSTAWRAKDAAKSYVRNALTAATSFPSFTPQQQCGRRECWMLESRIS